RADRAVCRLDDAQLQLQAVSARPVRSDSANEGLLAEWTTSKRLERRYLTPRKAEAEREKRAKIIAAEGEALAAGELAIASDVMMAHPLALQLRNLQTLVEVAVDKNSTVVFPAALMSTIAELGAFLERETAAARELPTPSGQPARSENGELVA
ncbi:MAG TPA: hypothetical protein VGI55_16945, partial [Solirubrobacteraceae bacterium]